LAEVRSATARKKRVQSTRERKAVVGRSQKCYSAQEENLRGSRTEGCSTEVLPSWTSKCLRRKFLPTGSSFLRERTFKEQIYSRKKEYSKKNRSSIPSIFDPSRSSIPSDLRSTIRSSINNPIFDPIRSSINNQIYDFPFPTFNLDFPF